MLDEIIFMGLAMCRKMTFAQVSPVIYDLINYSEIKLMDMELNQVAAEQSQMRPKIQSFVHVSIC